MAEDAIGNSAGQNLRADPTALTTQQTLREVGMLKELMETKLAGVDVRLDAIDKAATLFHEDLVRVPTAVDKAIKSLNELIDARLEADKATLSILKERVDARQVAIDGATLHLQELIEEKIDGQVAEKITGRVDLLTEKIKSLSDVTTQQFKSIDDRFAEKDKAVSVGLQAQKESAAAQQASNTEATTKMESNFTKLLDQGRELLAEVRRNTELQINDLKTGVSGLAARLDRGEGTIVGTKEMRTDNRSITGIVIAASVAFIVIMTAIVSVVAFAVSNRAAPPSSYVYRDPPPGYYPPAVTQPPPLSR